MLAAAVAGAEAELAVGGSAELTAEALAAKLSVDRQDRAGSLAADLRFEPAGNVLAADLKLEEPAGGLLAELLRLRGRPAIAVSARRHRPARRTGGPSSSMQADGARRLRRDVGIARRGRLSRRRRARGGAGDASLPRDYAPLVAGESQLGLDLRAPDDGAIAVNSATLRSEGVDFSASGVLGADMVPQQRRAFAEARAGGRAELPFVPGDVSVASLVVTAGLDSGADAPWRDARSRPRASRATSARVDGVALDATGQAENLASPDARATTFRLDGSAEGVALADPALREAVGAIAEADAARARGQPAQPVAFETLQMQC